jgi:hypothetical protein
MTGSDELLNVTKRRMMENFMKDIERTSPPWNDVPSKRGEFLESTLAVLQSSLGSRWPVWLIAFAVVMFLPTLIFRFVFKEIVLEPGLFVTEWLHLTIEGLFFFFILEIIRHRSMSVTAHHAMVNFVTWNYVVPTQRLIVALKRSREPLERRELVETLRAATEAWSSLRRALSDDVLSHLPADESLPVWIRDNRYKLDIAQCELMLTSLNASTLKGIDHEKLVGRLDAFLTSAQSLAGIRQSIKERS